MVKKNKKNLAICWNWSLYFFGLNKQNLFGKIQKKDLISRKLAIKQFKCYYCLKKGSLETNTQDNFKLFIIQNKNFINNLENKKLLSWFIGFAEGCGFFKGDFKNKRNIFLIAQKDPKILYKIKKLLGFGEVKFYQNQSKSWVYIYIVFNQKFTYYLILLFNGNLFLEKTKKMFKVYLDVFNSIKKQNCNVNDYIYIEFLFNLKKFTFKSGWLSGFIDAKGCFNVHITKEKKNLLKCKNIDFKGLYLNSLKSIDFLMIIRTINSLRFNITLLGEDFFMLRLSKLIKVNLLKVKRNGIFYNKIKLIGNQLFVLLNYLMKFPLRTSKNIEFVRFKKIIIRINNKKNLNIHLQRRSKKKLERLIFTFLINKN